MNSINNLFCYVVRCLDISIPSSEASSMWKVTIDFNAKIFYYVLCISVLGAILNFVEFIELFFGNLVLSQVGMWSPRNFMTLSIKQSLCFRIVECIIMTKVWAQTAYALISIQPDYMDSLLIISVIVLNIDVYFLLIDILCLDNINLFSVLTISLKLVTMHCVLRVQWTLIGMNKTNNPPDFVQ